MTVGGAVRTGRYRHSAPGSYTMVIQTKQLHLINRYRYTALITRRPAHGQALFTTRVKKLNLTKGLLIGLWSFYTHHQLKYNL